MASESSPTGSNVAIDGLSDVEATLHFTNNNDLRTSLRAFFSHARRRDSNSDHTVLVTAFPPESFIVDDDDEESPIPKHCKALYFKDSKTIVLTMPGGPQELVNSQFAAVMVLKLQAINCFDETLFTGRMTVNMEKVVKEPDQSWGSRHSRHKTCALEAGSSESNQALRRDARIWLEHPESHVTQVITIKISRTRAEIVFGVWRTTRQERATRSQHPQRAILDHEAYVTLEDGRPIADGTLRLSFEKFFERPPQAGTAERDIVFSARDLGGIARVVWEEMGYLPSP